MLRHIGSQSQPVLDLQWDIFPLKMAEGDPEVLMRNLSDDVDFDDEVKLTYEKYGVEGLIEKIDSWKNQPVKIAVTQTSSNFTTVLQV